MIRRLSLLATTMPFQSIGPGMLSLLLAGSILGCSQAKTPQPITIEREGMKVSVENNGRAMSDFESELIHRIELKGELLNFGGVRSRREFDGAGKVRGVRIQRETDPKLLIALGLLPDDVITAVGKRRVLGPEDLRVGAEEKKTSATLTFERNGVPHQNYYTILP